MTTRAQISYWLKSGNSGERTHMIVVCDTFDHEDYPVYVVEGYNIHKEVARYNCNMNRVMEVYSYAMDLDKQLAQKRAYNL